MTLSTTNTLTCLNTQYCVCHMCDVDNGLTPPVGDTDMYDTDNPELYTMTQYTMDEDSDKPVDVLGDLPTYEEMTLEEYISEYWYTKGETADDGCHRRTPTYMNKKLTYQDGSTVGIAKYTDDMITSMVNNMAWSEGSMLKLNTVEMVARVKRLITMSAWASEEEIHSTLKQDALDIIMAEKRTTWVTSAKAKISDLDALEPQVRTWLEADTRRMDITELFSRVVAYADKVNTINTEYQYRSSQCAKLFAAVEKTMYVPQGWNMPRYVASYIGKLYWARLTNKLHIDVDTAANDVVKPYKALDACTGRYVYAILNQIRMERRAEQGHIDNSYR
jgi:hypothetical protein